MDPMQGAPLPGEPGGGPADDTGRAAAEAAASELVRLEEALAARAAALHAAAAVGGRSRAGLLRWTGVVFGGAFLSLLAGQPEIAFFLALAAMFALTQSWDARDRALTGDAAADLLLEPGGVGQVLRVLLPAMLPLMGAMGYFGLALWARSMPPSPAHTAAWQWSAAAAVICTAMALPPVTQRVASLLVRPPARTHTARLTASLAMLALLFPVPMRLVFDQMLPLLASGDKALVSVSGLVGQLAGESVFALAAVGLWVARTPRETWARLGLGRMGVREWLVAAAGLAALTGLNGSLEWAERTWLPELWRQDQAMGELITRDMALGTAIVLGVSAGVGEELLVRGALQPRTGLLWASLLFAVAHVQYTWFGMLVIALLGVTLGLVRRHANTTAAIVVHSLYDIVAAFGLTR